jgi:hypothetical protein
MVWFAMKRDVACGLVCGMICGVVRGVAWYVVWRVMWYVVLLSDGSQCRNLQKENRE